VRPRLHPWDLVPLALLAAGGVTLLVVTRGAIVANTLGSSRALLLLAGIGVAWAVLAWVVLPRAISSPAARAGVMTLPALALLWFLVVPYFRPTEVVETLPVAAPAPATTAGPAAPAAPAAPAEAAAPGEPAAPATPAPAGEAPALEAPAGPVQLSAGELIGIGHRATGSAAILRQPDGSLVVELREIDVESGPDYQVHLVPGAAREDPGGGIHLDALRGTRGTQYYPVPPGADPAGEWTVLIWCRAFGVPIAAATQVGT